MREAEERHSRDLPVIEEMGASKRRYDVLKRKLYEAQRMLGRYQNELTALEKRRSQLNRAMGKLHGSQRQAE